MTHMTSTDAPDFGERWLTRDEVLARTGKSRRTLDRWCATGTVRKAVRGGRTVYAFSTLVATHRAMKRNYAERTFVAGYGRGNRHPATEEIRGRLADGETGAAIARDIGCSTATVTKIRKELRNA